MLPTVTSELGSEALPTDPDAVEYAAADARASATPAIRVSKGIHYKDPEEELFSNLFGVIQAKFVDVDAKLMERVGVDRQTGQPRFVSRHYQNLREMMGSSQCQERIKRAYEERSLKEISKRFIEVHKLSKKELKTLREGAKGKRLQENTYGFEMGVYPDEASGNPNLFRLEDTFLPSMGSPSTKQMFWVDQQLMQRQAFEAVTRNPIGKRISRIIGQFVLGRGVTGEIKHTGRQEAWDSFWARNKMRARLKVSLRELLMYGELFYRYFNTRDGLVVRSLDPSTIWDVVTAPDDLEDVYYYHQQYTLQNRSIVPALQAIPSTLIIRQIAAADVDHFKINATSSEKRGRSEFLAILGWLLRFKEFVNDRILLNKMRAMFALDVKVTGSPTEVAAAQAQFQTPPGPGAVMVHNESVETEFKNASTDASDAKTDAELILKVIAIGAGISEQFLGVSSQTNRASALIQTEPDVKNFEDYQTLLEGVLTDASERVFTQAGVKRAAKDPAMEFTFPALAQEDRSGKLKDIALSESMDYISKERAAVMTAREFNITTYDYAAEQEKIKQERSKEPVISLPYQQVPKEAPPPPAPTAGGPALTGPNPGGGGTRVPNQGAQAGFSAKKLSGRQMANTRTTLDRPNFNRGNEKLKVATNRSTGTPVREAKLRHVWSPAARQKSLEVRRAKALARRTPPAVE